MSQSTQSSRSTSAPAANAVAALYPLDGGWRAVVASGQGNQLSYRDARHFGESEVGGLDGWLQSQQVGRAIVILPPSRIICRTVSLPDAGESHLLPALRLQAETHLLGVAPPHRQSLAVLHAAPNESSRAGLIVAWPTASKVPVPPVSMPITYASSVASLAALLDGSRTDDAMAWIDPAAGGIAIAVCHAQGAIFRAVSEQAEEPADWEHALRRVVAETAMNVGHTPEFTASLASNAIASAEHQIGSEATLFLPGEVRSQAHTRISGLPQEAGWWARFGICVGTLVATTDQLAPLTEMLADEPIIEPSPFERISRTLGTQRMATRLALVALLVLLLSPLAFSGVRLLTMQIKVGDLDVYRNAELEREKSRQLYRELGTRSWSMSKLLTDVASAAPVGITFEQIKIDRDARQLNVASGQAESSEALIAFIDNLNSTGMFTNITPTMDNRDQSSRSIKFTLKADVADPNRMVEPADDFASETLAVRLYGERARTASNTRTTTASQQTGGTTAQRPTPPPGNQQAQGTRPPTASTGDQSDTDADPGRSSPRLRPQVRIPAQNPTGGEVVRLPEPLSDSESRELSRDDLMERMTAIAAVRSDPRLTEEQREQVEEQFNMLRMRLRELR